ncbi:MAG: hypothetical protein V4498_05720 [candidate division FCPU426 bacterium]
MRALAIALLLLARPALATWTDRDPEALPRAEFQTGLVQPGSGENGFFMGVLQIVGYYSKGASLEGFSNGMLFEQQVGRWPLASGEGSVVLGFGYSEHGNAGLRDSEFGWGWAGGLEWKRGWNLDNGGPLLGFRAGLGRRWVNWEDLDRHRSGVTIATVLEPTLLIGWRFGSGRKGYTDLFASLGLPINADLYGEAVGAPPFFRLGLAFGWD